ncbi:MAG: S4 domain-containing protein [Bacteroidales bacterium]|nr:S4 domain-containing protein [Bacteroidales bacterium]
MKEEVRIDKWMWAVRLFKTRSLAAEQCKKGKVKIGDVAVKPSRNIKRGETVMIKRGAVTFHFKVLDLSENRMNAKLVPNFMANVTPQSELDILEMEKFAKSGNRDRGTGRPTKKERRQLDDFLDTDNDFFSEEDFDE